MTLLTVKFSRIQIPTDNVSPREKTFTFLPLHTVPESCSEAVPQVELRQKKSYEQLFRRRAGRENSLVFQHNGEKSCVNSGGFTVVKLLWYLGNSIFRTL